MTHDPEYFHSEEPEDFTAALTSVEEPMTEAEFKAAAAIDLDDAWRDLLRRLPSPTDEI